MDNRPGQETDLIIEQSKIVVTKYVSTSGTVGPTAAEIAAAVLAALNATTISVDTRKINGTQLKGDGTTGNPWGAA
jgi:hypothetical protein